MTKQRLKQLTKQMKRDGTFRELLSNPEFARRCKALPFEINMNGSYKLGMDEVVGLREAMAKAFEPIRLALADKMYWHHNGPELEDVEYKSRDGFIPYKENCGGLMIRETIPSCEQWEFGFLEFGECNECAELMRGHEGKDCSDKMCGYEGKECGSETDNLLDAHLRIWFKFEGLDEDGRLQFYLNACGGNGDAPYFRVEHLADLFEASFTAKSIQGIQRAASKHIKALLKVLGAK